MYKPDERPQKIQELLAKANELLKQAAALADEIGLPFTFRGQRYTPVQTIPGSWSGEEWQSSSMDC